MAQLLKIGALALTRVTIMDMEQLPKDIKGESLIHATPIKSSFAVKDNPSGSAETVKHDRSNDLGWSRRKNTEFSGE